MCTDKCAFSAPVLVLGAAVVAFVLWITGETRTPTAARPNPAVGVIHEGIPAPTPEAILGAIQTGIPRAQVDRRLSLLPPPVDEPIDLSGGAPVCRVRYHVHLNQPLPQMGSIAPNDFVPGPYVATLEYDGRVHGHPLLGITVAPVAPR